MKKTKELWKKLNNNFAEILTVKKITIIVLLITIILLIPLLGVSFYIHPSADDFDYGVYTIGAINKGIGNVFVGVGKTIHKFYNNWQGTYSAITLFSLNPSIWGDNFYFLTTFILVLCISFSIYYLFKQLKKILKLDNTSFHLIYLLFIILILETIPDKTQGLYWWNGACYYMVFFSFELTLIAILLKRYFLNMPTKLNYIISCLLIIAIGGGNFITALQQIIILILLNIFLIVSKKDKSAILMSALSIISFLISALAPGNSKRASLVVGMPATKAILYSFKYSILKSKEWMTPLNIVIIGIIIFLLLKTYKERKDSFNHPLIVTILIYCIFSAEFTPTLYATSDLGAGRLWNIMYISYLLLAIGLLYYLIGNIRKQILSEKILTKNYSQGINIILKRNSILLTILIVGFLSYTIYKHIYDYTSVSTYIILKRGEAQIYDKEYKERIKILKNKNIKEVEFKPFTHYPYPIIFAELEEDETNWKNRSMAQVYNKKYVKIVKKES